MKPKKIRYGSFNMPRDHRGKLEFKDQISAKHTGSLCKKKGKISQMRKGISTRKAAVRRAGERRGGEIEEASRVVVVVVVAE